MNIFVLSRDPLEAARMQCDKHVVKMIIETAQMLCTVGVGQYKKTHINHPCTVWASKSLSNFNWLKIHGLELCREYTYRYGKIHKSEDVIISTLPADDMADVGLTPFALAMPEEFKCDDPVEAYRLYYHTKRHFAKWTKRGVPAWWRNSECVQQEYSADNANIVFSELRRAMSVDKTTER